MADAKLTQLAVVTTPGSDTLAYGVINPSTTPAERACSYANITYYGGRSDGQVLVYRSSGTAPVWETQHFGVQFGLYEGGSVLTTGQKKYLDVFFPFACEIVSHEIVCDPSGSIVVDLWVDTGANHPPTVADTITASAKPTISSATRATDSTLTGWTKAIAAGKWMRINVDSVTSVTSAVLALKLKRT